ncbi:MAG: hypothetical protein DMF71_14910 [Acidobacteria bacterium]|nr:MAG: hypothetical protein DMF71_14910 [Acidobacteriota bacterium]
MNKRIAGVREAYESTKPGAQAPGRVVEIHRARGVGDSGYRTASSSERDKGATYAMKCDRQSSGKSFEN